MLQRCVVVAIAVVAATLIAAPQQAHACTCAGGPITLELSGAAAVVIGRAARPVGLGRGVVASRNIAFRVERSIKGRLEGTIAIRYSEDCGGRAPSGTRVALLLGRAGSRWTSGGCSERDPALVEAAAAPLPAPDGSGPARFLVGGAFGQARVLALDDTGRTLAYGTGGGAVGFLAPCPGGRRVVEVVAPGAGAPTGQPIGGVRVEVRDISSFDVVSQSTIPVASASCRDADATELFLAMRDAADGENRITAIRWVRPTGTLTIPIPPAMSVSFAAGLPYAYLLGDASGRDTDGRPVVVVDLASGAHRTIGTASEDSQGPWASPDGTKVAVLLNGRFQVPLEPTRVAVIDVATSEVRTATLEAGQLYGTLTWLDDEHLLYGATGSGDHLVPPRIFDEHLRVIATLPERGIRSATVDDGTVFAAGSEADGATAVWSYRLPNGPARVLRTFDSPAVARVGPFTGLLAAVDMSEVARRRRPPPAFEIEAGTADDVSPTREPDHPGSPWPFTFATLLVLGAAVGGGRVQLGRARRRRRRSG